MSNDKGYAKLGEGLAAIGTAIHQAMERLQEEWAERDGASEAEPWTPTVGEQVTGTGWYTGNELTGFYHLSRGDKAVIRRTDGLLKSNAVVRADTLRPAPDTPTPAEPRVWSCPKSPEGVTKVRDHRGTVWTKHYVMWCHDLRTLLWHELLMRRGPLTEVVGDPE